MSSVTRKRSITTSQPAGETFLRAKQLAVRWGVHRSTVWRRAKQGLLEATATPTALVVRQWNSHRDSRTRDSHAAADGQRRFLDEPFDVGGERVMHPGAGSAANAANCRCVLTNLIAG